MKKSFLMICGAAIAFASCTKEIAVEESSSADPRAKHECLNTKLSPSPGNYHRAKVSRGPGGPHVVFRWDGCDRPLGVCLVWGPPPPPAPGQPASPPSQDPYEGTGELTIIDGQVRLRPDRIIYFQEDGFYNHTVPVDHDIELPESLCEAHGFESVTIKKGLYTIHLDDESEFGTVYLNAETTK